MVTHLSTLLPHSYPVVNINPEDRPTNPTQNLHKWNQQIAAIEGDLGLEGISTTSDSSKIVFTDRKNDAHGFGVLTITNDDPLNFTATTNYVDLTLGSVNDYFDVNEAIAATITHDGKYAFVVGRNSRLFGSGIESIDGVRAGSNVGIIEDPLNDHAKLVAATRPIPMGLGNSLVLSNDDKYLTVSYPGVGLAANTTSSNGVGATFTFDVQQMIATLSNNYQLVGLDTVAGKC